MNRLPGNSHIQVLNLLYMKWKITYSSSSFSSFFVLLSLEVLPLTISPKGPCPVWAFSSPAWYYLSLNQASQYRIWVLVCLEVISLPGLASKNNLALWSSLILLTWPNHFNCLVLSTSFMDVTPSSACTLSFLSWCRLVFI